MLSTGKAQPNACKMFSCCRSNPKAGKKEKEKRNAEEENGGQVTEKEEPQLNGKPGTSKEEPEPVKPEKEPLEAHNPEDVPTSTQPNTGTDATLSIYPPPHLFAFSGLRAQQLSRLLSALRNEGPYPAGSHSLQCHCS